MAIHTETLTLKRADGTPLTAYEARPETSGAPGVVVIHEIWGVDTHIKNVTERFAEAGYQAIAPDLMGMEVTIPHEALFTAFGAISKIPAEQRAVPEKIAEALEVLPADQRAQTQQLMGIAFKGASPEGLAGIKAAIDKLKQQGAKKVAVVGFCLGGAYVWAYAYSGGEADAFVPLYGRLPAETDPSKVKAPVLGHFGGKDEGIPIAPLEEAAAALRQRGVDAQIAVYPEAGHAFFNDTRDVYRPEESKLVWERTLKFFERYLK